MALSNSNCEGEPNLLALAENNVSLAKELIDMLNGYVAIDGVIKIQKQINQEIRFLQKRIASNDLVIDHILGSNLIHFKYLVTVLLAAKDVQHLDYPVKVDGYQKSTVRIDIVADKGNTWIKAVARNSKALCNGVKGDTSFGAKSILDHAENYVRAANDNPFNFLAPKVVFDFSNIIPQELSDELYQMGVYVRINGESNQNIENTSDIRRLNLDITTLLAYVSAQTNGSNRWIYVDPFLTRQAAQERVISVKKFLDTTFEDRELLACETAVKCFQDIISTLGGPNETERAHRLIQRLRVLPDLTCDEMNIVNENLKLNISGQVKLRSLKVFQFGICHKAMTVTSNHGFLRSARMQGTEIPAILHEARALTERKEHTATPILDD